MTTSKLEERLWDDLKALKEILDQEQYAWIEEEYPNDPYCQTYILQGLLEDVF